MKNFSLLLPTRNRLALIKQLFDSLIETTLNPRLLEIVLYIDEDDIESHKILYPSLPLVKLIKPRDTMGNMIRKCYEASRGRYIILINDDVIFRTENWDAKILKAYSRFSDEITLIYVNDLYYGRKMCTFPILSRTTCHLMNKICPGEYRSHCIDAHIFDIFRQLSHLGYNRTTYRPKIIFEHMNYKAGASVYDAGSIHKNDMDDQSLYFSFAEERKHIAMKMAQYIESRKE